MRWGVVPAAGAGTRIQPLAFSKELLPVGSELDGSVERPRAVSQYLVDRMCRAGVSAICFVVSPQKADILAYYGALRGGPPIVYAVQPEPVGLCDAIFRALPLVRPDDEVVVGLPDTVWFPEDGLCKLDEGELSFLLFPVERPELFDAVVLDEHGSIVEIQVKSREATTPWIWGAFRLSGRALAALHALWLARGASDHYLGALVNDYIARGGTARGVRAGQSYFDVGTLPGYRDAIQLLRGDVAAAA